MSRSVSGGNGQVYTENYTEYTDAYPVAVDASFKILDVKTAKVIAMDQCRAQRMLVVRAENQRASRPSPDTALSECKREIVTKFMNAITPYTIEESVGFPNDSSIPGLNAGVRAARIGQWEDAIVNFRQAVAATDGAVKPDPKAQGKAHYSLGVALWMTGSFDEAETELKKSFTLDDQEEYRSAFLRCQKARADSIRLNAGK